MATKKTVSVKRQQMALNRELRRDKKQKEAQERRHAFAAVPKSLIQAIGQQQERQLATQP